MIKSRAVLPTAEQVEDRKAKRQNRCDKHELRARYASATHEKLVGEDLQLSTCCPAASLHFCMMAPHPDASLPQQGQSSFAYVLDGKAIFAHHDVPWRRRTEAVDAQHASAIDDVAMPTLRSTCFDGKSRMD